jgi:hypothetical protein
MFYNTRIIYVQFIKKMYMKSFLTAYVLTVTLYIIKNYLFVFSIMIIS